jgi:predicted site-specific integrase-resolvase
MSHDRMVTLASVARRLNRSPETLQAWANRGEFLKPLVINRRRYLSEQEVEAWLRKKVPVSTKHDDGDRRIPA